MLIHEIVDFCNNEYRCADTEHLCPTCNHPSECSGSCKRCLEQVHFPDKYPEGKHRYDCKNMMCFYVCDYINKYASEILHLLHKCEDIQKIHEYHILSIGCGAAPDLMAFEQFVYETEPYKQVFYLGIDLNKLWQPIHAKIKQYESDVIKAVQFVYEDAISFYRSHTLGAVNIIVLQYVISYFYNTNQILELDSFFDSLINNIVAHKSSGEPCIVIINDTNSYKRGRDSFIKLYEKLRRKGVPTHLLKFYFDYNIQYPQQKYGIKHDKIDTLFDLSDYDLQLYDPWVKCSSAQLIIVIE